ncbi:DUF2339 domain-containing protein [Verrucomicrobiales bacterium BCK34]|nr:DUF2339 domain-containing protein [Verrucomicrobiales bacterium BCK34]
MELLVLLIAVLILILVSTLVSRVGEMQKKVDDLKYDVSKMSALVRSSATRDRAEKLRESSESEAETVAAPVGETLMTEPVEEAVIGKPESESGLEDAPVEKLEPVYEGASPPPLPPRQAVAKSVAKPAPAPAAAAGEPGKFESAAKEVISKLWNWIVVGEEHRPANVTMEFAVATTWLLRLGVLILVIGIGFFLKYSIDQGRVAIASVVATGLLVVGLRLFKGRYGLLGQGLAGAGISALYLSFFAAYQEGLVGPLPSYGLMCLVTLVAGVIALRFNSLLVAVLGILGGYLTPMMIETSSPSVVMLFAYLLLLGVGVFFMAGKKEWRILHYLSFICTYGLVGTATDKGFAPERFWEFMPFLVAFFVLFSTVTFLYHFINRKKSTLLEILFLFVNAGVFLGFASLYMNETFQKEAVAIVTIALAIFYVGHVYFFMKRGILDRGLLMSFLGLAAFFVAITLPLVLSDGWVNVSWAIQAFVMLWIASKISSVFLRQLAYVLYLIVLARFAIFDLSDQFGGIRATLSGKDYALDFVERLMVLGVPIASFFAAGFLFGRGDDSKGRWIVGEKNDVVPWFGQSRLSRFSFWIVLALGFVYLNMEVFHTADHFFEPFVQPGLTLVWIGFAAILLRELIANRETLATAFFWILSVALVIKVLFVDFSSWSYGYKLAFRQESFLSGGLMRFLDYGALIGYLLVVWRFMAGRHDRPRMGRVFAYTALAAVFLYSSLEIWTALSQYLPRFRMGGISIFWSVFALVLLLTGISKRKSSMRGMGLLLLGGVILKVFFVDLAGLDQLYRIIAFIILGVVVLAGSFLYLKYRNRFEKEDLSESEPTKSAES